MSNTSLHETPGQHFRFMDLPVDVRLMVYERMPRVIKHTPLRASPTLGFQSTSAGSPDLILITRHISTAILATCRMVYAEANSIVKTLLKTFILDQQPRIIIRFGWVLLPICAILNKIGELSRCTTTQSFDTDHRAESQQISIQPSHRINTDFAFVYQVARIVANTMPRKLVIALVAYGASHDELHPTVRSQMNSYTSFISTFEHARAILPVNMRIVGRLAVRDTKDSWTDDVGPRWQYKAYQHEDGQLDDAIPDDTWLNEWLPSSDIMSPELCGPTSSDVGNVQECHFGVTITRKRAEQR